MNDKYIKDTLDDILNKKFSKNLTAGYDSFEVDVFFDDVRKTIVDIYKYYSNISLELEDKKTKIANLKRKIEDLEYTINVLNAEINDYRKDGYQSQKIVKDISEIKREIINLKKENNVSSDE